MTAKDELQKNFAKVLQKKKLQDVFTNRFGRLKRRKKQFIKKLGITKDTELLLCMICEKLNIKFSVKEIHIKGLNIFEDNEQCK